MVPASVRFLSFQGALWSEGIQMLSILLKSSNAAFNAGGRPDQTNPTRGGLRWKYVLY